MKKYLIIIALGLFVLPYANAQKFGFVDTKYILNNIPSYKAAEDKLDELSKEWQQEVEEKRSEIDEMYKKYQQERVLLSDEMKQRREDKIIEKEKALRELQKSYFGNEGKLYEKRKELVKPIQDEVYEAIKEVSEKGGYAVIFDTASGMSMLYTDPKYDKSDEVLRVLGYKN